MSAVPQIIIILAVLAIPSFLLSCAIIFLAMLIDPRYFGLREGWFKRWLKINIFNEKIKMAQQNRKKRYRVPVTWSLEGYHEVEAWNADEASDMVDDMDLPTHSAVYIDGSCETVNHAIEEIDRPAVVEKTNDF